MIAAAAGQAIPLGWVSAGVGVLTFLVVALKAGRVVGNAEQHLRAQDEMLARQDEILAAQSATLARQDGALGELHRKLDALVDRPPR